MNETGSANEPEVSTLDAAAGSQLSAPRSLRHTWAAQRRFTYPASVFVVSRIVTMGAVWVALRISPSPEHFGVLQRWDGGWYIQAAEKGYSHIVPALEGGAGDTGQSTHAFFPLVPLVLRAGHAVGLSYLTTSLVLNTVAGVAAAILLWHLIADLADSDAADRAVAIFCLFPGSYVYSLVYADGVLIPLAVGCLLALRRRRWFIAGALAAVASATRPNGLVLALCCAWEAGAFIWRAPDRRRAAWALVAPALSPLGAVVFLAFLWNRTGHLFVWLTVQRRGWGQTVSLSYPIDQTRFVLHHPLADINRTVSVIGLVSIVILAYFLYTTRPPVVLWIYSAGIVALALGGNAFAHPRFILTAFPLVAALGQRLKWPALCPVLSVCVAALVGLTMLFVVTTQVVP